MGVDRKIALRDRGMIDFYAGANRARMRAPAGLAASYDLTLPPSIVAGQFLTVDGSGNLSWAPGSASLGSAYTAGNVIAVTGGNPVTLSKADGGELLRLQALTSGIPYQSILGAAVDVRMGLDNATNLGFVGTHTAHSFEIRRQNLRRALISSSGFHLKGGPFVDVKACGALGDDAADDRQAFLDAIAELPAGGGTVYVPQGTYRLSDKIQVSKPVRFMGCGWSSILKANGTQTAVLEFVAGANGSSVENLAIYGNKAALGGYIQRGVHFNGAKRCLVVDCLFSGPAVGTGLCIAVDVQGSASAENRIFFNRFERLVSSGSNGTAVLLEYTSYCQVVGNIIDGTDSTSYDAASAAIFLTAESTGTGCTDNTVSLNVIKATKGVGIAINSSTYAEVQGQLGACERNLIEGNEITATSRSGGGDGSSGIVIQANSSFNRVVGNKVHHCGHTDGGYGIVVVGSLGVAKTITGVANNGSGLFRVTATAHGFSTGNPVGISGVLGTPNANGTWTITVIDANTFDLQGSTFAGTYTSGGKAGITGTVKIDEVPVYNEIRGNCVYQNKENGIYVKGGTNTRILLNSLYENGQKTANTYFNILIEAVGGTLTGAGTLVLGNEAVGAQPSHQLKIGSGVNGTRVSSNDFPVAASGAFTDLGTNTTWASTIKGDDVILSGTTGKVGIGSTSPSAKLHVRNPSGSNIAGMVVAQEHNNIGLEVDMPNAGSQPAIYLSAPAGYTGKYIDTTAGAGTPAHLSNAGDWVNKSCFREFKEDFEDVDGADFLEKIRAMKVQRYRHREGRKTGPKEFGPFQDDLVNRFGLSPEGVRDHELAGIALVGVQELARRVERLEKAGV